MYRLVFFLWKQWFWSLTNNWYTVFAGIQGETEEDAEIRKAALQSRSRSRSSTVVQIPTASIQMDLHTLYLESVNAQSYKRGMTGVWSSNLIEFFHETHRHMWRFVGFGSICAILKTWKTPMEECYFCWVLLLVKATLLHGCFHVF